MPVPKENQNREAESELTDYMLEEHLKHISLKAILRLLEAMSVKIDQAKDEHIEYLEKREKRHMETIDELYEKVRHHMDYSNKLIEEFNLERIAASTLQTNTESLILKIKDRIEELEGKLNGL